MTTGTVLSEKHALARSPCGSTMILDVELVVRKKKRDTFVRACTRVMRSFDGEEDSVVKMSVVALPPLPRNTHKEEVRSVEDTQ